MSLCLKCRHFLVWRMNWGCKMVLRGDSLMLINRPALVRVTQANRFFMFAEVGSEFGLLPLLARL